VLGELAEGATDKVDCSTLDAQLHINPERLKVALREAVAEADKPGATIVLGYGLCSNAVIGLKTEHATLVVPKVDDCIAMLLGSNAAFAEQSLQACGTYYLAKSYIEECDTILSEHDALVERRGAERAEKMMRLMLKHYTRVVLIDTGRHDMTPYRERVNEFARRFDLEVEDVAGTTRIVDALVEGGWGDDFVVAPPGHELTLRDFRPEFGGGASGPK
jgi:nucleotide-binding universal stress UspA family protein